MNRSELIERLRARHRVARQQANMELNGDARLFWAMLDGDLYQAIKELEEYEAAITELQSDGWVSVEEFDGAAQHCWIMYKGRQHLAFWNRSYFEFIGGGGVYMTECVTHVMPKPAPPRGE